MTPDAEGVYHRIDKGEAQPNRQPPTRLPLTKQEDVGDMLENIQRRGVITESANVWSSPSFSSGKIKGTCVSARTAGN
jgi:hypothetical protein